VDKIKDNMSLIEFKVKQKDYQGQNQRQYVLDRIMKKQKEIPH